MPNGFSFPSFASSYRIFQYLCTMKHLFIVLLCCVQSLVLAQTEGQTIRVTPVDNGQAMVNPGMGWQLYYYSNVLDNYGSRLAPEDIVEDFPGMSMVFLRLPWSFLEPEKDRFNWEIIDTPAQRWLQTGRKVAFCISATENWTRQGTPQWVFDEGAKYYEVNGFLEVDYEDLRRLPSSESSRSLR